MHLYFYCCSIRIRTSGFLFVHFFQTKTNTLFPNTWVFETLTWVFCSWDLSFAVLWPEFLAKMDLSFEKSCLASSYKGIDNFYQPWGHKISLYLHFYVWIQKILSGLFPNTWVFLFLTLSFAKNTWVLAKTWVLDGPEFWSKCTKKKPDLLHTALLDSAGFTAAL